MKRLTAILLSCMVLFSVLSVGVSAAETKDILLSQTVEELENGDSVVTKLYQNAVQPRTGAKGYKSSTYYSSSGTAIFTVTVNGTFTYSYGSSSKATASSAVVEVHSSRATFVSKNASMSGKTATAKATVKYSAANVSKSVSVSCDIYGNLS